ncbi:hypothetical protein AK812_SmicGene29145 [Symbiodinium microadriaticum]|uniref:Uncharacterized protein n=1 Tax=Symbiodinium microadriaticum TaxID=2951 RepID=A0A1Q9D2K0_SYMMI|nr:hypothetical protein AK812_SmicGene29145 [Symbiodinium microadriaticum]
MDWAAGCSGYSECFQLAQRTAELSHRWWSRLTPSDPLYVRLQAGTFWQALTWRIWTRSLSNEYGNEGDSALLTPAEKAAQLEKSVTIVRARRRREMPGGVALQLPARHRPRLTAFLRPAAARKRPAVKPRSWRGLHRQGNQKAPRPSPPGVFVIAWRSTPLRRSLVFKALYIRSPVFSNFSAQLPWQLADRVLVCSGVPGTASWACEIGLQADVIVQPQKFG